MVEEEQKYEVDDAYVLPDLAATAPAGVGSGRCHR